MDAPARSALERIAHNWQTLALQVEVDETAEAKRARGAFRIAETTRF